MIKKLGIVTLGLLIGLFMGTFIVVNFLGEKNIIPIANPFVARREVIGFLPYWLLNYAKTDYSKYITTLSYFALRVDQDGYIQKLVNPQEEEPGWNALHSGKLDQFFNSASQNGIKLSLMVASGDTDAINGLISSPEKHAINLISDLKPLITKYKFTDVNLDIEYTQSASPAAQNNFTAFVKEVKKRLGKNQTLTVEISPVDVIKNTLINPGAVGQIADSMILMAYDYHATSSYVTGPVAPQAGAGVMSEYDVTSAVEKSLDLLPAQKLILGVPNYGYEWETLTKDPRAAIIPNTGVVASNRRSEELLNDCATCSATLDPDAQEKYITYVDQTLGDYHTFFFPDKDSMNAKINLAKKLQLEGLAVWALGYEGNTILSPLEQYKN